MTSLKLTARYAAVCMLLTVAAGLVAQGFLVERLIDFKDGAVTAGNILAHKDLLRLAFAVFMFEMAFDISTTALMYELLRPVDRALSRVAAALNLTANIIKTSSRVFFLVPLLLLGGSSSLSVFSDAQLQALSLLFLKIMDRAAGTALIFYGFSTLISGALIFRSGYLPRFLGVTTTVCGIGWATYLYPPLYQQLFFVVVGLALLGVAITAAWFLFVGPDEKKSRVPLEAAGRV